MARPSLFGIIRNILEDLDKYDLRKFKACLRDPELMGEFQVIRKSKLETEDFLRILEVMFNSHGLFTIEVTKKVLKEIQIYTMLEELCGYTYSPEAEISACQKTFKSKMSSQLRPLVADVRFPELDVRRRGQVQVGRMETGAWGSVQAQAQDLRCSVQAQDWSSIQAQDRSSIQAQDLFQSSAEGIRTVLTTGEAGVGKTLLTQKFSLDWAEDRTNRDVHLLFRLSFTDLNKFSGSKYNLVELLHHCFQESRPLFSFQYLRLLFILDGLDRCTLPLDFNRTRVVSEPTETAPVEQLLVNLIRGDLCPSARIWITARPGAAPRIPESCVSMVTELRGFSGSQRRMREEQQVYTDVFAPQFQTPLKRTGEEQQVYTDVLAPQFQTPLKRMREEEEQQVYTDVFAPQFQMFQSKVEPPAPQAPQTPPTAHGVLLLNALKNLVDKELEEFVFHLLVMCPRIPAAEVRGASRTTVATVMIQFDRENAVRAALHILKTMGKNELKTRLSQESGIHF